MAAVLRDASSSAGIGQFAVIQSVASTLGFDVSPINLHDADDIDRGITAFARSANGGVILTASSLGVVHQGLILTLAARHKLPAVYSNRVFADAGGLISYGPDLIDPFRKAAGYVDRILNGEKPAELPVQAPTRYERVINLKTAKALDLIVPPALLARADDVVEFVARSRHDRFGRGCPVSGGRTEVGFRGQQVRVDPSRVSVVAPLVAETTRSIISRAARVNRSDQRPTHNGS